MVRVLWLTGLIATLAQAQQMAMVHFNTSAEMIADTDLSFAVIPQAVMDTSPLLNATGLSTTGLQARTAITVQVYTSIISTAGTVILAGNAAADLYDRLAAIIKDKSEAHSCTLIYGTESDDSYYEGYAYQATTVNKKCNTNAEKSTIETAVKNCATRLHAASTLAGCCKFSHGGGAWTGHLRLTASPKLHPVTTVTC